jgi:Leucine-rich repeat (LRR) protein
MHKKIAIAKTAVFTAAYIASAVYIASELYNLGSEDIEFSKSDKQWCALWLDQKAIPVPNHVTELTVYTNTCTSAKALSTLNKLPNGLKKLYINTDICSKSSPIHQLPNNLPDSITHLACTNTGIYKLPDKLPSQLHKLVMDGNMTLTTLDNLPDSLHFLSCGHIFAGKRSNIKTITYFPPNLKHININNNNIRQLPELPLGLETLACDNNPLEELPDLPSTLYGLNIVNNYELYETYPLLRDKKNFYDKSDDDDEDKDVEVWWVGNGESDRWEYSGKQLKRAITYVNGINAERRRQRTSS